jgi:hypothetical protein
VKSEHGISNRDALFLILTVSSALIPSLRDVWLRSEVFLIIQEIDIYIDEARFKGLIPVLQDAQVRSEVYPLLRAFSF